MTRRNRMTTAERAAMVDALRHMQLAGIRAPRLEPVTGLDRTTIAQLVRVPRRQVRQ